MQAQDSHGQADGRGATWENQATVRPDPGSRLCWKWRLGFVPGPEYPRILPVPWSADALVHLSLLVSCLGPGGSNMKWPWTQFARMADIVSTQLQGPTLGAPGCVSV